MKNAFERVQPAMALAAESLDRDVGLDRLASAAALSPFHMHRLFSAVAGETPKQFSLRLRLGRAASLLLTDSRSVMQVALACGFDSHDGFTRAFKRRFGMTPSAYRKRGFAVPVTRAEAAVHARLVDSIGPCVGLYHTPHVRLRPGKTMTYEITTKEVDPQPVLLERRRVRRSDISTAIGEVVYKLFEQAQREGIALTGKPFTRYPHAGLGLMTIEPGMRVQLPEGAPSDAWEPSSETPEGEVRRDLLTGGTVATTIHSGVYEDLHLAYTAIEEWMIANCRAPRGAPWEAYLTSPTEHSDPADWKTEVFWPI